jgi:hypothetical protein
MMNEMGGIPPLAESEASKMKTIADPALWAERLKTLNNKVAEAAKLLQQAKEETQRSEDVLARADAAHTATMGLLAKISLKEDDLVRREDSLNKGNEDLDSRNYKFDEKMNTFNGLMATLQVEANDRMLSVEKAEQVHAEKKQADAEAAEQYLTDKRTSLDMKHAERVLELDKRDIFLREALEKAQQSSDAAASVKADYEARVAQLKKVVG